MTVTTTLEPVSNYQGTDGYTPLVPSVSQTDYIASSTASTITQRSSSLAATSTNGALQGMVDSQQQFTSGSTIGLAIGLPVGVFCLGLILFLGLSSMRKGLTVKHKKSTVSPTTVSTTEDQGWLSKMLCGSGGQCSEEYDFEKSFPLADSCRIQYKVSKSKPLHILTPQASKSRNDSTSLERMSIRDDIDTLLYSRPPDIYGIESEIPSRNNLASDNTAATNSPRKRPKPPDLGLQSHKWNYKSPLSSWFLRNSTYLANDDETNISNCPMIGNVDTILTPTVQLKQLKILSRINKNYVDGSQLMENEKSPFLEKSKNYDDESMEENGLGSNNKKTRKRPSAVSYGTVSSNLEDKTPLRHLNNNGEERRNESENSLSHRLWELTDKRHLSLTPKTNNQPRPGQKFQVGHVYKVVQDYDSVLADEIDIRINEFVLILATHTDGWCLVEKCTANGTSNGYPRTSQMVMDAGDARYLNNDRGIVPGDCLDNT